MLKLKGQGANLGKNDASSNDVKAAILKGNATKDK
ncbi:Variable outer membrane protein [Borrelia duttonii CR2A]|uniref:Variable outer membrane protein n=1 Tax=Borrelia duttonii CR2A TaxID=1432657 RepID=W6TET7_9SPIR|nr:hypothetical protein [Borrelia duttonii]ETZ17112.1 Variable outer membrane protein [Borrelia duttonii CR2A]